MTPVAVEVGFDDVRGRADRGAVARADDAGVVGLVHEAVAVDVASERANRLAVGGLRGAVRETELSAMHRSA